MAATTQPLLVAVPLHGDNQVAALAVSSDHARVAVVTAARTLHLVDLHPDGSPASLSSTALALADTDTTVLPYLAFLREDASKCELLVAATKGRATPDRKS